MLTNKRKFGTVLAMAGLLSAFGAGTSRADIVSTFNTDDEGWSSETNSPITYFGTGGNPGGFVTLDNTIGRMDAHAPDKFLGDLTSYLGATLSFDAKNISGTVPDFAAFGRVDISNSAADSFANATLGGLGFPLNDGLWHTFSVPLTADFWHGDLEKVLGGVDDIRVDLRPTINGGAVMGFDNFRITRPVSVPEPNALCVFLAMAGAGGGFLLRRKR